MARAKKEEVAPKKERKEKRPKPSVRAKKYTNRKDEVKVQLNMDVSFARELVAELPEKGASGSLREALAAEVPAPQKKTRKAAATEPS